MDDQVVILSAAKDPAASDEESSPAGDSTSDLSEIPDSPSHSLFRPPPRDRKWLVSLSAALAIHAALIVAGLAVYKATQVDQPPQLLLPVGWASEFNGSG